MGTYKLVVSLAIVAGPKPYFVRPFFYNISTCMQQMPQLMVKESAPTSGIIHLLGVSRALPRAHSMIHVWIRSWEHMTQATCRSYSLVPARKPQLTFQLWILWGGFGYLVLQCPSNIAALLEGSWTQQGEPLAAALCTPRAVYGKLQEQIQGAQGSGCRGSRPSLNCWKLK